MYFVVLGAGAVGCYFGGLLAKAGHAVTFVGRAAHVEAINANGLLLETKTFTGHVTARAATDTVSIGTPDCVLVCVKSDGTEAAGTSLLGHVGPQTAVLSLQNGVDNAHRLSAILAHEVIPSVVYVGTEMAGPGHVRHHGRGELLIGASPASEEISRVLCAAQIPTTVTAAIQQALWVKCTINCAYNALSAVADISYGPMLDTPGAQDVIASAVAECIAVAKACGVALPADMLERALALAPSMPHQKSSTAQDLARGKTSEIDFLNGYVVRKGSEFGIATPTNQALQVMVKLAERSNAASS